MANWQGRTAEIANLKQWLNNPNIPLIGIEGIGGIGKSMLSAYIYENETIAGFRKRFWADVSSGAIFTDVATQVLQDFGFRVPEQETQLVQTLVKCLQSDEFLLIIDNLESLLKTNGIWGSQFYEDFFKTWVECGGKRFQLDASGRFWGMAVGGNDVLSSRYRDAHACYIIEQQSG